MSRHAARKKKNFLITFILLTMAISMVAGAVAYSWLDSIDHNIHRNKKSISRAEKELNPAIKADDPINILILGSDKRYKDDGDTGRSDTLMIMRIDFEKKRVYLVSIPRDTRVKIPGRGYDKINAAYSYGGPQLSIRTVESFTGMELNHYVEVDFQGFKKMVDALGGIEVDVKETINNRQRGYTMYIPKGVQKMNGSLALNYVRYRHGDNDFKRAERQQNFLRALAGNALRISSIWKVPRLISILSKNIETDFSMREMTGLMGFMRVVGERNIETVTVPGKSGMRNGVSYVFPDEDGLQEVVEAIEKGRSVSRLKEGSESGKISVKSDDDIRVMILNGTSFGGLAGAAKLRLTDGGIEVIGIGNASSKNYLKTEILADSENLQKAVKVKNQLMKSAIVKTASLGSKTDVTVILGKDYYDNKGF